MATLSIHACSPSLSTALAVETNVAVKPYVVLSLLPAARGLRPRRGLLSRGPSLRKHSVRRNGLVVPKAYSGQLPDPEHVRLALSALSKTPDALEGLLTRTEGLFFTLADAAVATDPGQVTDAVVQKQDGGWLGGITNTLELALTFLKDGIAKIGLPYSYGFAIILLTVIVKAATYPLTKKQVESTLAMQNLQPKIKAIQTRYQGDQERIQLETARLYKQAGVNPLAGCLPTLATLPVWIGLYRALSNVANEGLLTEGFFWIPSLAGPTTIAARSSGSGISWLFPFVDGAPPLGWGDTIAYLVLPVLLIGSQYVSMQIMQPATASNDPAQNQSQLILKFLPLMIGYFSLSVPSGLSLYWLTNNVLSTAQQVYLRQLGGAQPIVDKEGSGIISAGQAKRTPLPPPSATATATDAPTSTSTKDSRGTRFKQLKEEEARKKEARRKAAEEASKAAAAKAAEERDNILRAQLAQEAQKSAASAGETSDEAQVESDGEKEDSDNSKALAANGAVGDSSGKQASKRSKRRRSP
ncbi:inner membrane protein PPF-1, chloroplastic isoform X2 [Physcomitrium patens]|uniref:Membrane insertase YidC/Oxa/ALB C-terminal domain-containing protein n=1 Tax=Physcomitrium patens TaxID=3218 RepID=A0A7I4DH10_PHYPA